MESSTTTYLRQEAFFKLENNKNTDGTWSDNDAIAALHLVSFSQLSGASIDWEIPFNILSQWLMQQNLVQSNSGDPWMTFLALSPLAQILVKATLVSLKQVYRLLRSPYINSGWMFSRVFRYYGLQSFCSSGNSYSPNKNIGSMATTSTCPSDSEWICCQDVQTRRCLLLLKFLPWLSGKPHSYTMAASATQSLSAGAPPLNSNYDSSRQMITTHGYRGQTMRCSPRRKTDLWQLAFFERQQFCTCTLY